MSNPIATILAQQPLIVLDGALATELERCGCDLRDPLWSARVLIDAPDLIHHVHTAYFAAGADCAITASYQATLAGFERRGLSAAAARDLMARSVTLALNARDQFWSQPQQRIGRQRPFVAASIGPYGAFLADGSEYRGDYGLSTAELIAFHRPRMELLIAAGAEVLACETIPCYAEAEALAELLSEFAPISAWISFSARDHAHTCHGEPIAECAALLDQHPQIAAIGINCTAPTYITGLIANIRRATSKPIVVYPNSGEQYDASLNTWHGTTECTAFGAHAQQWYAAGAQLIGGCCRTTPEHILAIRELLRSFA